MRILAICVPLLLLAGCDGALTSSGAAPAGMAAAPADAASGAFDYRYAYRISAARIEAVQESHARGCDQLGTARCRNTAVRYNRADQNNILATLTAVGGCLLSSECAGSYLIASAGRGEALMARLRAALYMAEAQGRAKPG